MKNCFVFGGSKGIGYACAKKLAIQGYKVSKCSRSLKNKTKHKIDHDNKIFYIQNIKIDLSNLIDVKKFLNLHKLKKELPDILIFSNGGPTQGDILNIDEEEILKHYNVDYFLLCSQRYYLTDLRTNTSHPFFDLTCFLLRIFHQQENISAILKEFYRTL